MLFETSPNHTYNVELYYIIVIIDWANTNAKIQVSKSTQSIRIKYINASTLYITGYQIKIFIIIFVNYTFIWKK